MGFWPSINRSCYYYEQYRKIVKSNGWKKAANKQKNAIGWTTCGVVSPCTYAICPESICCVVRFWMNCENSQRELERERYRNKMVLLKALTIYQYIYFVWYCARSQNFAYSCSVYAHMFNFNDVLQFGLKHSVGTYFWCFRTTEANTENLENEAKKQKIKKKK